MKPSWPKLLNLKNFTISFWDQMITPSVPVPVPILVFYYASTGKNVLDQSNDLKKSLSETLTHFYPLAGTIGKDNKIVDCDDYGVQYLETRVDDVRLSEVLGKHPDEGYIMNQFIPTNLHYSTELGTCSDNLVQLVIQVNMFDCGGMVIGVSMLHKIADAASLSTFVKAWARTSSRLDGNGVGIYEEESTVPNFDAKAADNLHVPNPTKVESVTALFWKLKDHSLGNFIAPALVGPSNKAGETDLPKLVESLRSSIRKIDGDYIKDEFQVNYGLVRSLQDVHERFNNEELELHTITSWCRFPFFYESDFGWGKPTWVCTVNVDAKNVIILVDTSEGNGIEAWVTLEEQRMLQFESDYELLEFILT
ncbi:hypothetical protein MKW92_027079 [Papaver armeniacum]|nr:hypothetical protein MKW92_027079 [Papaver armeniacum]